MKTTIKITTVLLLFLVLSSCSSVRVASDYDTNVNLDTYKTFAFYKTGIDKAEINDLDKRRILRAIEAEMLKKGFTKSESPDVLISIFTKSRENVNIYNNNWNAWGYWGWGWGWNGFWPGWGWNQPMVSTSTEGQLFIDIIDSKKKELIWQGSGTGYLTQKVEKKEARIQEFVSKILEEYPPEL